MSLDKTINEINYAANSMESAQARLRQAIGVAIRDEFRNNLPSRFMPGANKRYRYPPYAPSTITRKMLNGTPPLVETGAMRTSVLSSMRVQIRPDNTILLTVQAPHYAKILYDRGYDFLRPTVVEMKRIVQRARVLPANRFGSANIQPIIGRR